MKVNLDKYKHSQSGKPLCNTTKSTEQTFSTVIDAHCKRIAFGKSVTEVEVLPTEKLEEIL